MKENRDVRIEFPIRVPVDIPFFPRSTLSSAPRPPLRPDQFARYRRHLTLPELGLEGQQRLLASSVLLIGAGGLGCPAAQYLAAAGVGTLGLVDDDVVAPQLQNLAATGLAVGQVSTNQMVTGIGWIIQGLVSDTNSGRVARCGAPAV